MTKVYLLTTGREIPPFGTLDSIAIHNELVPDYHERVLRAAGGVVERISSLDEVRTFPSLLVYDDVYYTVSALRRFLRGVRSTTGNQRAALRVSQLTEAIAPELQGECAESEQGSIRQYDIFYLREFDCDSPPQTQSTPLVIRAPFGKISAPAHPKFGDGGRYVTPFSHVYLCPMRHWANMLACNAMGMAARFLQTATKHWAATAILPLVAACRAGSVRPSSMVSKVYWKSRRTRIHPTAVVEGAVLGRRVRIGPHAVVRFCVIGDNSVVGPGAFLEGCTLGRRTIIAGGSQARGSIFGDESSIATAFNQLSVIGRRAVLCPNAGILDFSLRGTVPVTFNGESMRSGALILGSAVGDDAFIGPNIEIAGGREIPANCIIVRNPRELVRSADPDDLPQSIRRMDRRGKAA